MIKVGLTPREKAVFDFVRSEIGAGRLAPTFGEIGAHIGVRSKGWVSSVVRALARKGFLVRGGQGHARSLLLCSEAGAYTVHLDEALHARLNWTARRARTTPEAIIIATLGSHLPRAS